MFVVTRGLYCSRNAVRLRCIVLRCIALNSVVLYCARWYRVLLCCRVLQCNVTGVQCIAFHCFVVWCIYVFYLQSCCIVLRCILLYRLVLYACIELYRNLFALYCIAFDRFVSIVLYWIVVCWNLIISVIVSYCDTVL